ncbi:DNA-binding transcriptional regulator, MerR family [Pedococcus cremeus]|uniref:DNA-binding transcriptional regulator, MerR family n=1 Tax=Pedococcus cremeus TaxID=587636 RepID=A0A1H9WF52_9MICO|nr:MerR family transcriptional regulator [Pedococcus cremeus]SES32465.1 DNA-binding transcriptional regulator, MerR family [Pedococcus cremeus]
MTETTGVTLTVGQVAERFGVTVRTLHHYDEIGLLSPSERSNAGYRLYTEEDLTRLQHVVVYRRLGFALEDVAMLLEHPEGAVEHLRRQRTAVLQRLGEMRDLVTAIDRALEREMSNQPATPDEMKELFGEGFHDAQAEAEERWGETDAWHQSQERTKGYTKADWEEVKAESDRTHQAFTDAMDAGEPPTSEVAMDAAELHRASMQRFYDCSYEMHRGLADMYVSDPRFTATYDEIRPGMAHYVRDAIHANADRHQG